MKNFFLVFFSHPKFQTHFHWFDKSFLCAFAESAYLIVIYSNGSENFNVNTESPYILSNFHEIKQNMTYMGHETCPHLLLIPISDRRNTVVDERPEKTFQVLSYNFHASKNMKPNPTN